MAENFEVLMRKFKKRVKTDKTLEYYKFHEFFMTKKEKKLAKQRMNRQK